MMPGWADAMVDFMRSGGYNVAAQITEVEGNANMYSRIYKYTKASQNEKEVGNRCVRHIDASSQKTGVGCRV